MRPLIRRALRALVVGPVVLAGFSSCGISCDHYESVLATDERGRTVRSTFEACGPGVGNTEWLDLVSSSGQRRRIFAFEPTGGVLAFHGTPVKEPLEPVVTWLAPDKLHIAIGTVGSVVEKHDTVNGVHVTYDIAMILYPSDMQPVTSN
jgi:hypothetical protein